MELINHENITIKLETEAKEVLSIKNNKVYYKDTEYSGVVVFTGMIDEFLEYKHGRLPYRTLEFKFEHYEQENYQGRAVVNYTVDQDYTRITEYTFTF